MPPKVKTLIKVSDYCLCPGAIDLFWQVVGYSCRIKGQPAFGEDSHAIFGKYLYLERDVGTGYWIKDVSEAKQLLRSVVDIQVINFDSTLFQFVNSLKESK